MREVLRNLVTETCEEYFLEKQQVAYENDMSVDEVVENDLINQGFSDDEISQIYEASVDTSSDIDETTGYKIIAYYAMMMSNPWDSLQDMKEIFKSDYPEVYKVLTKNDLKNIYEASQLIEGV